MSIGWRSRRCELSFVLKDQVKKAVKRASEDNLVVDNFQMKHSGKTTACVGTSNLVFLGNLE